ncbi:hypothetical protein [Clostridium sp. UBA6640]|uniref:hypothetical protein n=1 Tax=Clostridium sp. UBA6640 TaxID=1946370 RepID=UPI0025BF6834|nr:hypothetical protein [Clostridium sp. UBA6640]
MEIVLSGNIYDERINIKYDDIMIYNDYVDNLVTSEDVDSDIELKLNYGDKSNQSNIIVRRSGKNILCLPNIKYCFKDKYMYIPIIFSLDEFKKLWEAMGYSFENDIEKIKEATNEELMLAWYITSNIRDNVDSMHYYVNTIKRKFICTDIEGEDINKQIYQLFNWNEVLHKMNLMVTCKESNSMTNVKIYLDDNVEWDAIKIADKSKIYLNLSNKIYISILN